MTVVDDIRARLDIVDVVSGYVTLQKAGRNFKAPCPFHAEKTPSFVVNPERQSWHCFGACSTGGDAFSFVMRHQNVEFPEALRILAQRAGVELSPNSKQENDHRSKLHRVNQLATTWYQERLRAPEGAAAMEYLKRRGVNAQMIDAFQLGYSPDSWDGLKNYLNGIGVPEQFAVESGLIYRNDESGRTWDFFRDRLMFPIHDRQGKVSGFGGRQLSEPPPDAPGYNPKYINTSSTPIFDKRSMLYGIHRAKDAIRESNTGIVVEGYMDVIAAHQHGYHNVVASMGTALTENQVAQLKSLATNFVLALDPDNAGQEATLRSLESSWQVIGVQSASRGRSHSVMQQREAITLSIAALPEGKDPDELIRHDPAEWERLTTEAPPLMSYLIPAIAARFDTGTGQGKSQVVEAIYPLIAATQNPFDQQRYMQDLADTLGITLDALKAGLPRTMQASARQQRRQYDAQSAQPARSSSQQQITASALDSNRENAREDYMLGLLLNFPQLREYLDEFSSEYLSSSANREIFARWQLCADIVELQDALDDTLLAHMQSLLAADIAPTDGPRSERARDALRQCLQSLKRRHLLELQQTLLATIDNATPPPRELAAQITSLNEGIRATEIR
ncbi:MAG: DNA primase [Chloroflexota bacterium]|nr:DNA primase [Chloroflexota bacterium]